MPENIDEMLERLKPMVSDLFKKMKIIDDKIADLTAARNKISNTGVTHPTVISQIETLNNVISGLTALRSRIYNQLDKLSKAMKRAGILNNKSNKSNNISGGGLDNDVTELMRSIEEYLEALDKLDDPDMSDFELDELEEKLKTLRYLVEDRLDDIDYTVAEMEAAKIKAGGKKRKTKKTKKINKKSKKTKKINKKSRK
jgi:hypothetical protein